jgi:hypothetical protein
VNGGLARNERRRVKPSAGVSSERSVAVRPHRITAGEDRNETQGNERSLLSGFRIAKSGEEVVGPGL